MGLFDQFKKNKTKLDEDSMKYGVALITRDDPKSGISEQYRTIRTNLKFSFLDPDFKILAVMSAVMITNLVTQAIVTFFGGKPVNQILGSTLGTLIFAIVYNQIEHLGFPHGMDLLLAILSGVGWACAQIVTFYSFTLIGSSRAMPVTTAFQLLGASLWGVVALGD